MFQLFNVRNRLTGNARYPFPRTVSFSRLMQCRVPSPSLNGGGSNTLAKLRFKVFPRYVKEDRRGEFLSRGDENARKRAFPLIDGCSRLQLTIRSVRKLPYEGREGALSTQGKENTSYIGGSIERELQVTTRSVQQRLVRTTDGPSRAFLSLPSFSLSLFLSWTKDLRIGMHSHENEMHNRNHVDAFSRTNERATNSGSLHRERETTNPACLYSPRVETTFWQRITRSNSGTIVLSMNYYCP